MSDQFQKWPDTGTIILFVYTKPANVVAHYVIIIVWDLSHCTLYCLNLATLTGHCCCRETASLVSCQHYLMQLAR